jgi:hypothetical protein
VVVAFLAISIDVNFNVRLQRSDWSGVAAALRLVPLPAGYRGYAPGSGPYPLARVITIEELGSAPLEYYLPPLHNLLAGQSVRVREIDEVGFFPLRAGAADPPAPGFKLISKLDVNDLIVYRFVSPTARRVSQAVLIGDVITVRQHPEVLAPGSGAVSVGAP